MNINIYQDYHINSNYFLLKSNLISIQENTSFLLKSHLISPIRLFIYAMNNPIKYYDPFGLEASSSSKSCYSPYKCYHDCIVDIPKICYRNISSSTNTLCMLILGGAFSYILSPFGAGAAGAASCYSVCALSQGIGCRYGCNYFD